MSQHTQARHRGRLRNTLPCQALAPPPTPRATRAIDVLLRTTASLKTHYVN